ncbi:hypothetical protein [Ureibacillus thermosphaericus]|uniref:hypothetical protein n=1 Tax=Ureibacillus thermosphaericus TaxID=51173 RepID=UPI0030C94F43
MRNVVSNSITLYFQEFWKLILLSFCIYVPLLLLHAVIVNSIYQATRFSEYPGLAGDMANGIFMIVFLTIAQVPFIKFTLLDMDGEEKPLKKSISFALDKLIPIYIFACLYAIFIFIGGLFFVIPGVIILLLFYFVPYFIADNVKGFKSAIKKSVKFMKKNVFKATVIILLLMIIQLLFENILVYLLTFYTNVYFVLLLIKIIFLMFLLPLQTIIITNVFNQWKPV